MKRYLVPLLLLLMIVVALPLTGSAQEEPPAEVNIAYGDTASGEGEQPYF